MAQAKVLSTDAIRLFRAAMIKFAEAVNASLGNADSDVNRAQMWLDMEAKPYWNNEVRKRQDNLAKAQERLRMKLMDKQIDGTSVSAVDEKKAVDVAKRRLEVAEQKVINVRRYSSIMTRETVLYKGSVTRFATTIQSGVPVAVAHLSRVMMAIDRYLAANPDIARAAGVLTGDGAAPVYLEVLQNMSKTNEALPAINETAGESTDETAVPPVLPDEEPVKTDETPNADPRVS